MAVRHSRQGEIYMTVYFFLLEETLNSAKNSISERMNIDGDMNVVELETGTSATRYMRYPRYQIQIFQLIFD